MPLHLGLYCVALVFVNNTSYRRSSYTSRLQILVRLKNVSWIVTVCSCDRYWWYYVERYN